MTYSNGELERRPLAWLLLYVWLYLGFLTNPEAQLVPRVNVDVRRSEHTANGAHLENIGARIAQESWLSPEQNRIVTLNDSSRNTHLSCSFHQPAQLKNCSFKWSFENELIENGKISTMVSSFDCPKAARMNASCLSYVLESKLTLNQPQQGVYRCKLTCGSQIPSDYFQPAVRYFILAVSDATNKRPNIMQSMSSPSIQTVSIHTGDSLVVNCWAYKREPHFHLHERVAVANLQHWLKRSAIDFFDGIGKRHVVQKLEVHLSPASNFHRCWSYEITCGWKDTLYNGTGGLNKTILVTVQPQDLDANLTLCAAQQKYVFHGSEQRVVLWCKIPLGGAVHWFYRMLGGQFRMMAFFPGFHNTKKLDNLISQLTVGFAHSWLQLMVICSAGINSKSEGQSVLLSAHNGRAFTHLQANGTTLTVEYLKSNTLANLLGDDYGILLGNERLLSTEGEMPTVAQLPPNGISINTDINHGIRFDIEDVTQTPRTSSQPSNRLFLTEERLLIFLVGLILGVVIILFWKSRGKIKRAWNRFRGANAIETVSMRLHCTRELDSADRNAASARNTQDLPIDANQQRWQQCSEDLQGSSTPPAVQTFTVPATTHLSEVGLSCPEARLTEPKKDGLRKEQRNFQWLPPSREEFTTNYLRRGSSQDASQCSSEERRNAAVSQDSLPPFKQPAELCEDREAPTFADQNEQVPPAEAKADQLPPKHTSSQASLPDVEKVGPENKPPPQQKLHISVQQSAIISNGGKKVLRICGTPNARPKCPEGYMEVIEPKPLDTETREIGKLLHLSLFSDEVHVCHHKVPAGEQLLQWQDVITVSQEGFQVSIVVCPSDKYSSPATCQLKLSHVTDKKSTITTFALVLNFTGEDQVIGQVHAMPGNVTGETLNLEDRDASKPSPPHVNLPQPDKAEENQTNNPPCLLDKSNLSEDTMTSASDNHFPGKPSNSLMLDIARAISTLWECIALATELEIGEDNITKVAKSPFTSELVFNDVLHKWVEMHGRDATKARLYMALLKIQRKDLAHRFENKLIGNASTLLNAPEEERPSSPHKTVGELDGARGESSLHGRHFNIAKEPEGRQPCLSERTSHLSESQYQSSEKLCQSSVLTAVAGPALSDHNSLEMERQHYSPKQRERLRKEPLAETALPLSQTSQLHIGHDKLDGVSLDELSREKQNAKKMTDAEGSKSTRVAEKIQ